MQNIENIKFSREGQEVFEKIITIWPPILREQKGNKIRQMLSLLMQARKVKTAGREMVIDAAKLVVPKSYDPLFHMMEDMEKFKKTMMDTFVDMDVYNRIPVRVRRWKRPRTGKSKTGPKTKKVTAFCASPRKGGNTDLLIDAALKGAGDRGAKTEKIMLQKIKMGYCVGCRQCKEPDFEKSCIVRDDMSEIYQKINDSAAVVIGFPIYTGRECAQLCTFLDRWDCFERYLLKPSLKPGRRAMVIGTWGYPHIDTYDHVIEDIITILNLHQVETVEALSACGFEGILHGLDDERRGVIARFPKQLKKAWDAGAALANGL